MPPELASPTVQVILAAVFGGLGVGLLLPKPRYRSVAFGVFLVIAAVATLAAFLYTRFGQPVSGSSSETGDLIGSILFWLFAAGAVGFGVVLVTQRNPARGAIAFAFVVLSTCGLFLLLAAPFLMAATVIVYAGAIVVTFLFVLMLSHVKGPSDENDRTREPLLGGLAGFAFVGLILFTLHLAADGVDGTAATTLPAAPLSATERAKLQLAVDKLDLALSDDGNESAADRIDEAGRLVAEVTASKLTPDRKSPAGSLVFTKDDPRTAALLKSTEALMKANDAVLDKPGDQAAVKELRSQVSVYRGTGLLPARNVANLGVVLYSEHLLAVEMAGTLLLVATIGAVAIAQRRKEVTA